ncbi:unnamed protein product [Didymodactylos carnosus]|uniref:Reverse transcriptase domain-containing protein n=1 Tax=Didymodactylos carnosus TaxID=1234261 RepID=A0A813ZFW1_9BILA|nr:unnamed protein product [Didymodactylos carnosus]CAF3681706.1 unnamed protein product [Didymodactylos carnosus]
MPDKGKGVVILGRKEYIDKMNQILNDTTTFSRIYHDPTIYNEDKLIRTLLRLKEENFITDEEYKLARPTGSRPARIYGLPKIHKPNIPLRLILSATKTIAYGLGKILSIRLAPLRNSPFVVRDTGDFVKRVSALSSEDVKKKMISFDVTSLFTKVPLTYTIELILNELYPECTETCRGKPRTKQCSACKDHTNFETLFRSATSEGHPFSSKYQIHR